jgi:hypothetical protein
VDFSRRAPLFRTIAGARQNQTRFRTTLFREAC